MRQRLSDVASGARQFVRRHRPDYQLILYIGILLLLGLVVLYAISPARTEVINEAGGHSLDQAHFMQRQLMFLLVGLAGFAITAIIPLTVWQKYAGKILAIAFILCGLLVIFGMLNIPLALCTSGACRWFNLGFTTFQPAELVKFGLLLFTAGFLARRVTDGKVNSVHDTIIPLGIVTALSALFIIVFQKDMGTGVAMFGILATMLFVAGVNKRIGLILLGAVIGLGILLILIAPHRIERVTTFLNPTDELDGSSYHINQAKLAIGSGGLFGLGLGKSVQAFGYLPEAVNDSIFAIMGELFGFVGLLALLALFTAFLLRILRIMDHVGDPAMKLLVAGVFGWVATHVVVNIGAMTGIFPLTGLTLPLLSFGGTSLLFIMLTLGLVFQISRYTSHIHYKEGKNNEGTDSRRRLGRTRHANLGRY